MELHHHLLLLRHQKKMKIIIYLKEEMKSKRMIKKITLQVMAKQTTVERGISLNSLNNPMVQPMLQELKVLAQL